jgi:hypothetical protein
MPLYENATQLIRGNFSVAKRGRKPRLVPIGYLTDTQLDRINENRRRRQFEPIDREVVFVGSHLYESRILEDGYTIDDVLRQISCAMSPAARWIPSVKMTVIENPCCREDGYGNCVNDQAVLECTSRFPRAELFSVIPRGDRCKPPRTTKGSLEE